MIFIYVFLSLFLLVFLLLLIPFRIYLDSNEGVFFVEWKNIVKANVFLQHEDLFLRLKIFYWQKEINLLKTSTTSTTKKEKKKEKSSSSKKWKFKFRKKIKRLLNAIQVKQFYLNIDTDDYVWNAYLYPIFHFLKREKRNFQINYNGNVEILLELQSRPIHILYVLLF